MKKAFLLLCVLMAALCGWAQQSPLWLRYPALSPDGQTIVFSYQGNLFSVPTSGGEARQLTSHAAYDAYPVWSPDGSRIAFASSREGSMDVFIMSKDGGAPQRLTTDSGDEFPMAFKDAHTVLYSSVGMPSAGSILFASRSFPQVYAVRDDGTRPRLFSALPMLDVSVNNAGELLYHDKKGYEDEFRKHHQSPITRDVWYFGKGKYTRLTSFKGEDRTPVWAPGNTAFYYLSEQDGTFNVWKQNLDGAQKVQITHHTKHPVRFLTADTDGLLCYGYDGEIYTVKQGEQPKKVNITIRTDQTTPLLDRQLLTSGATEIKLSPTGKEIAFVLKGDVYVTAIDYKTTRRITDTPQQERNLAFSPDGRSLAYASERTGIWQLYQTRLQNKADEGFAYAAELKEERLTQTQITSQQPQYSPDGKQLAFFQNRGALCVMDLKSRQVKTVMDGKYNFSYSDGDLWFQWSPDSRWLLSSYIGVGGWNSTDIALVNAQGNGEIHNLTQSGYGEGNGKWVLGGKAMLFESDRAGYRSHGSWGAEDDVYIMFFDLDAYERFNMSKEEKERLAEAEKKQAKTDENKNTKNKDKDKKAKSKKNADDNPVKPLVFDLENCRDRVVRLTVNSSHLGDFLLSPGGDTLYYQASFEDGADLWKHDLREQKTELVIKKVGNGAMQADKDFKNLYLLASRSIKKVDVAKGTTKNVPFEAAFNYKPYEERAYLFDHVWQQVKDKFYVENLHGVDWEGYHEAYKRFLPYINNNYDFRDLLSEMLGELNASHTGARYYPDSNVPSTASLGLFFDDSYTGSGLKVEEVIKRGPFAERNTGVVSGCIIEKIDGVSIEPGMDYNALLDGKAGKRVRIAVYNPATKKHFDTEVKPVSKSELTELLYKRWVDRNRELVNKLSNGRIAYVHVKAMNSESFRTVYRELLSDENRNKDAVIVDERHNGGGWLHDDLCTLLSGKEYQKFVPHGKYVGSDPYNKWTKPSCVLMCEDDYSNGHGFPWVYKTLGIGKLVGTPVAGTMTAVWWETLMDPSLVFGIPQVGCMDMNGHFGENQQLNPDVEVYNSPDDYLSGHDRQLEEAVRLMMKQ